VRASGTDVGWSDSMGSVPVQNSWSGLVLTVVEALLVLWYKKITVCFLGAKRDTCSMIGSIIFFRGCENGAKGIFGNNL
jgi:hypothetical protein